MAGVNPLGALTSLLGAVGGGIAPNQPLPGAVNPLAATGGLNGLGLLASKKIDQTALQTMGTFMSQDPYLMTKTAMGSGVVGDSLEKMKGIEDMMSFARFQVAGAMQDIQTTPQFQAAAGLLNPAAAVGLPPGGAAAQGIGAVNSALAGLGGGGSLQNILQSLATLPATRPVAAPLGGAAGGLGGLLQMLMGLPAQLGAR